MASQIKSQSSLEQPFQEGLLTFLAMWFWTQYAFEPSKATRIHLKVQAGFPAGLNLYFNLPTVFPQGHYGNSHKAVARPSGASRFCVFKRLWPFIRGRDGPG